MGASDSPSSSRPEAPLAKFNPNHDEAGRFTTADGATSGGGSDVLAGGEGNDRLAQVEPAASDAVNLKEEEEKFGGHTISRHVARLDEELLENVRRDRYVGPIFTIARRAQGSFLSIEDANNFVNRTLDDNRPEVDAVANGKQSEAEFIKRFGYVTGKEAFRPDVDSLPHMRPTYEVYVHIQAERRSKKGFRVFRSYPLNARPSNE